MNEKLKHNIEDAEIQFYINADKDTIDSILKENTPDFAAYQRKRDAALIKIKFLAKATVNKHRDQQLLLMVDKFREAIEKNIDKPLQVLRSLMSGSTVATGYYNKLEKLTKENIIELIKDQNLVNLLEQLNQDGTDNKREV